MINKGLVMRIQSGIATSFPACRGGFEGQLPPNAAPPAYSYRVISDPANTTLRSFRGFGNRRYEFKCWGIDAASADALADAIDAQLDGFSGVLTDPDATRVDSMFRTDRLEADLSPSSRNFWVMLEYSIWFYQP